MGPAYFLFTSATERGNTSMPRLYATRRTPHPTERRFDLVCKAKVNSTAGLDVREYNSPVFKSFPMCRFPWTENVTESDCRSYADQLGLRFASIEHASDAYANATTTGFKCSPTGGDSLMPSKCARTLDSKAAIYGDGGYGKYDNTYSRPDVNHRVVFSENDGVPNGGETGWNGCEQTMRVCRLDYDAIREFDLPSNIIMKSKYEGYLKAALTQNLFCANTGVQERPRLYCKTEFEWRDDVSIPITLGTPYATTPDVLGNVVPLMSSQGLIRFPTQTHTQPPPPASPILDTPVPLCHGNATCIPMYPFQQDACQQVWNMQTQGACAFDSNANSPQGAIDCSLHNCSDFIDCNHGGDALRCAIRQAANAAGHQCEAVCELVPQYGGDSSPRCGIDEVDGQIVCPASSGGDGSALFKDVYLSVSRHVPPAPPSLQMTPPPPPFLPFPPYDPNASTVATYNLDARWQGETAHGSLARWPERLMGVMRAPPRGATASSHAPGFPYTYVYQQAKDGIGGSLFDPVAQRGRIVTYEGNDAFDTRSELGAWEPAFDSSEPLSMSWMMIQSDPLNSPIDLRNVGFLNVVNSMVGITASYTDQFGVYCLKETTASAGYLERFKQRYAFQNVRVSGLDACSENSINDAEDVSMWTEFFSRTSCGQNRSVDDHRFGVAGLCAFGVDCSSTLSLPTTSPLPQTNPIKMKQCYNILILARHATGNSHSLRVGLTSKARPTV